MLLCSVTKLRWLQLSSCRLLLLLLLAATLFTPAHAQFRVRAWTTADGLPQNTVNAVVQTRDGYLWIATFGGLVKFDGVRFTFFNTVNAPALRSQRITAIHEDRAGVLWIATETGEISCLRDGDFYSFDDGEEEEINSLLVDKRGFLWAGGWGGARRYKLPETGCGVPVHAFERIKPPPLRNQAFDLIWAIIESDDGSFWLNNFGIVNGEPGRILRWREGQPLEVFDVADDLNFKSPGEQTRGIEITDIALAPDASGRETLWVASRNGLLRFDGTRFVNELAQNEPGDERFKFTRDERGRLMVNVTGGIAHLADDGRWRVNRAAEITGKKVRSFFADREGNLWLGTNADGLLNLKPSFVEFYDESSGVLKNQTGAVLQDLRGNLWIAGYGLHRFENNRFIREKNAPLAYLLALAETRDETLLVGGYDIFFARRADGSITDLKGELQTIFNDAPFAVKAIFEDSRGALWLGFRDKGLLRRDRDGNYQRFTTENGLVGNQVQYITETRDGAVWFGVLGGASRFADGLFTNFTTADGFANDNIRSITETADGSLYFGTYGGGLSRLKNGEIRTVTMLDGLFDDVVSRIIVDVNENFWMLGNHGIFTAGKTDLDGFFDGARVRVFCRSFGTADGMKTAEGNGGSQPAGWMTADGQFWFPTILGYARIAPPAPDNFLPSAVIETVTINNKSIDTRELITINPGDQNLEIRYTGLSFNHSEQLRFRYKLQGFDKDWTEAGTRRTAYFTYPPTGEYVFTVQAANADGVWNERAAEVRLRVLPPVYRTWWFSALAAFLAVGFGYAIYALRVSSLTRARRAQEELSRRLIRLQEEERKRIAGDLHDGLSQNLVIIKNRAMLSLADPDDLENVFEQIEEIADAAQESLAEVRQIAANLRPFQIDRLGLTKAIEALTRKTNAANLQVIARVENIDGLFKPEMEINLYRIVQESLNNIVKHSSASQAIVEIERGAKTVRVTISDNGKGFDFQDIHRTEQTSGNGFGLMGMHERARILGTTPMIESGADNGTSIRLIIPV